MENKRYQYHLKKIFSLAAFMLISCVVIAQKRLVGATSYGGDQFGTIFSIDAGGAAFFSQLNLEGNPGFNPYDKMVEAANGKLYGITTYGGPAGCGVLFEYDVNTAQLTTKIAFSELDNRGAFPTGSLVQAANGKLYGQATTPDGTAGIIYEYDPITDTYTRKFDLPAGTFFGTNAMAEAPDGNLYGITAYGGLNNAGFIFSYNFTGNVFNVVFDMATTTGSTSLGPMLLAANGKFYGTTNTGGTNNAGVIFEYDYVTNNYTDKIDLLPATGSEPWGSLTAFTNGKLYGHSRSGGASNNGVLFEYDYTTNTYTKKIDMEFATGAGPQGSLTVANNGKMYGITPY